MCTIPTLQNENLSDRTTESHRVLTAEWAHEWAKDQIRTFNVLKTEWALGWASHRVLMLVFWLQCMGPQGVTAQIDIDISPPWEPQISHNHRVIARVVATECVTVMSRLPRSFLQITLSLLMQRVQEILMSNKTNTISESTDKMVFKNMSTAGTWLESWSSDVLA